MIPRAYSEEQYIMTELLTGDIQYMAGTLEYAPARVSFDQIMLSCSYSPVHPEMLDDLCEESTKYIDLHFWIQL